MNPITFAMRRPVTTLLLVVTLASGGVLGLSKLRADIVSRPNTPRIYAYFDYVGTTANQIKEYIVGQYESYFHKEETKEQSHEGESKIVLSSPLAEDVVITQRRVCQIHSQRHIDVCALDSGYLERSLVKEGQAVKKGDVMFKILPVLYKAKRDAEVAEARLAELEFNNTERLFKEKAVVSENEVKLFGAKLARAKAKADWRKAELNFADVTAPFDGIVDRLHEREGSLIKEGDILTTLSDNSVMWVYFNVPERRLPRIHGQLGSSIRGRGESNSCWRTATSSRSPARSVRSRPNSTTRPGTSHSVRIFRTRTACCVTVRPAPS